MINSIIDYLFDNHFLTALIFVLVGWLILKLNSILIMVFVAYILMTAVSPIVGYFEKRKIPRAVTGGIIYILIIVAFLLIIVPIFPFIVSQVNALLVSFPQYLEQAARIVKIQVNPQEINNVITSRVGTISDNAFYITGRFFGTLFSAVTILIVSFYLLIDYDKIKSAVVSLFHEKYQRKVATTFAEIEVKMGAWVRGQLMLMLIIGVFTFIALSFIGLKYALPLAIIAGFFEFIPTLGPILGAVPAVIVALTVSVPLTVTVILIYILIQALEGNLIVPKVMQRAVGLHPLIIILGIVIGGELMGIKGALLSIPFISMIAVIWKNR